MTASKPRPRSNSSFSGPTEVSNHADAILALGKKLIADLKLADTNDTLSRWMVHYLAEQIKNAEQKTAKDYPQRVIACRDAIFALWQHRHELPTGSRPFQELEPILRTLASLHTDAGPYRYFQPPLPPRDARKESKASQQWLQLAERLDYSARILIRQCLANAADNAIDKSKEWVALAQKAGLEQIELPILRIIIADGDLADTSDPDEEQRKLLKDRADKLRGVVELATTVIEEYESQLNGKPDAKLKRLKALKAPAVSRLAKPAQLIVEERRSRRKRPTKKL
ncbi:hypothetical protein X730_05625 [Mesorhizobium sp. L103C565B0]|nr:hypothetical protein X730_05625 [Mesorhizobium sp. L103C565B0]